MEDITINVCDIIREKETDKKYRVIFIQNGFCNLCAMDTDKLEISTIASQYIAEKILRGEMEIALEQKEVVNIKELSDTAKKKYDKYSAILKEVTKCYGPDYLALLGKAPKEKIGEIIERYNIPRNTLWRIIRLYLQTGFDVYKACGQQAPKHRATHISERKRGRKSFAGVALTPEVLGYFDEALTYYKEGRVRTVKDAFTLVNLRHYRSTTDAGDSYTSNLLPMSERPTLRQFQYYVKRHLSDSERDALKTSKAEQRNNKRLLLGDVMRDVAGPGDLAEIDAVEIDVSLVSETSPNQTIGRPIAYVLIDVFTRAILAVSVAFDNNSQIGLSSLLLNLLDDKVEYCRQYGLEITPDKWPSNCIPRRIRCDRGSDFKSKYFADVCERLGIQRDLVPGGSGSLKGIVEQSFHQMHAAQNFALEDHGLIEKRYDSQHHKEATLTLRQYMPMFLSFVLSHNSRFLAGYPLTKEMHKEDVPPVPFKLWQYGITKYGAPRPINNKQQYLFDLMMERQGSITRRGILFDGLYYLDTDDSWLFNTMYRAGNKRITITLRYDPRSVNYVYYIRDGKLVRVGLKEQVGNSDYRNWTFKEWDTHKKLVSQRKKAGKAYNEEIDVGIMQINQTVVDSAGKARYSQTGDMRVHREEEKQKVAFENRMEKRLLKDAAEKSLPQPEPEAAAEPEPVKPVEKETAIPTGRSTLEETLKVLDEFNDDWLTESGEK